MLTALKGLNDSLSLLAFRFQNTRFIAKLLMFVMVAGTFVSVYFATFTSEIMLRLLSTPIPDNPSSDSIERIKTYIATYLSSYDSGDISTFVTISVILLSGSIIFVPFSGYIIHGVVSNSELTTIKNGDYYRVGDSILFQFISSFTYVQLVGLTVIAELLTIDTKHPGLVNIFVWVIWVALTLATSLIAWIFEFIARKYGKIARLGTIGSLMIIAALALIFDPKHGLTLFGLSPKIFEFVQNLSNNGLSAFIPSIIVTLAVIALILVSIGQIASRALALPELASINQAKTKTLGKIRTTKSLKMSYIGITVAMMFRYNTVMRPIFTSVGFSVIIALVIGGGSSILTTLVVIPLAVGISFGANMFGLFGNANNWLLSLPDWRRKAIPTFTIILLVTIAVCYTVVYGTAALAGRISFSDVIDHLPGMISVTGAVTALSIIKTIKNPLPFSAKTRENVISAPLTLIGYVASYIAAASIFGNIPSTIPDPAWAWAFTGFSVVLATLVIIRMNHVWKKEETGVQKVLTRTVNAG